MADASENVLPLKLASALRDAGQKLELGQTVKADLSEILRLMNLLPAGWVTRAAPAIAEAARLYHRRPAPSTLRGLFTRRLTDKEQLLALPGLEYLFLFHHDGRIREAALQKVSGGLPSAFLFASVAWRLNDWAQEVRAAAVLCAERNFPATDAQIIANAAPVLLLREGSWGRWASERRVLEDAFSRTDVAHLIAEDALTSRTGPTATMLRHALRRSGLDGQLEKLARHAAQPSVRSVALQALIDGYSSWPSGRGWQWVDKPMGIRRPITIFEQRTLDVDLPKRQLIEVGLDDRSAAVRRIALSGLIRHRDVVADAPAIALRYLDDRSASVRERAAFIMRNDEIRVNGKSN